MMLNALFNTNLNMDICAEKIVVGAMNDIQMIRIKASNRCAIGGGRRREKRMSQNEK